MTSIAGTRGAAVPIDATQDADRARLQSAVRQLQGVFVEQMLKAMRETVPDEGVVNGGAGEDIFTSMLDAKMASLVPESWQRNSLESALFRQLRIAAPPATEASPVSRTPDSNGSP
jgi:flagellar protein FlgJ